MHVVSQSPSLTVFSNTNTTSLHFTLCFATRSLHCVMFMFPGRVIRLLLHTLTSLSQSQNPLLVKNEETFWCTEYIFTSIPTKHVCDVCTSWAMISMLYWNHPCYDACCVQRSDKSEKVIEKNDLKLHLLCSLVIHMYSFLSERGEGMSSSSFNSRVSQHVTWIRLPVLSLCNTTWAEGDLI